MGAVTPEIMLDGETILKAYTVAGHSVEALRYLQEQLNAPKLQQAFSKTNQTQILTAMQGNIVRQIDYLDGLEQKRKPWQGDVASIEKTQPSAANYQVDEAEKQLEQMAAEEKAALLQHVTLVYQIDESAQFLRGYLRNGNVLDTNNAQDASVLAAVDQVFQSWLVANQMESKDGVIYQTTDTDTPAQRVDPRQFSAELNDEVKGLNAFAKQVDAHLDLKIEQQQARPQESPS